MKLSEIDQATIKDVNASFNIPETLDPSSFRDTTDDLTADERRAVINQALFLIEEIYVHLPLKRAMHAIDPGAGTKAAASSSRSADRASIPQHDDRYF